jgi:hypothetical protein
MKILYTLGQFVHSGHPMLFYTINGENKNHEGYQVLAERTFEPTLRAKNDMFRDFDGVDPVEPPAVGDVIWTHTSGNQHIACGIWQETPDSEIDLNAFRLICKSVLNKAKDLNHIVVSIPLLTLKDDLEIWKLVYPIIEDVFKGEDVQVVCHIPTEIELVRVLDAIGGNIKSYQREPLKIRFVKSKKE